MKYVDYLIVGGGISGSVLAYVLQAHGADVHLFDLPENNRSSAVAAGLWNPIVLKRLKKVWEADACIDAVYSVYPAMEEWSGGQFFDPLPIRRIFHNPGEQNQWLELSDHPAFAPYLGEVDFNVPAGIRANHGSGLTEQTGRVRVPEMLAAVRAQLQREDSFSAERFDWTLLQEDTEGVTYGDFRAHAVISCEGVDLALGQHPAIKQEGFAPVKGEVLQVQLDADLGKECIHQGHFMLGEGDGKAFVGATYAWDGFEDGPTQKMRDELEGHVRDVWAGSFETLAQQSGVRPAMKDRRPVVGKHASGLHRWVFNGMGSRGILMAPWLATRLAEHLLYGVPLPEEVAPDRFGEN